MAPGKFWQHDCVTHNMESRLSVCLGDFGAVPRLHLGASVNLKTSGGWGSFNLDRFAALLEPGKPFGRKMFDGALRGRLR